MNAKENLKNLTKSIKIERINRDLTQADVAKELGINRNYYSQIEGGMVVKPGEDTLIKLAKFFNFNSDDVLLTYGILASDIIQGILHNPVVIKQLRESDVVYPPQDVVNHGNTNEARNYE